MKFSLHCWSLNSRLMLRSIKSWAFNRKFIFLNKSNFSKVSLWPFTSLYFSVYGAIEKNQCCDNTSQPFFLSNCNVKRFQSIALHWLYKKLFSHIAVANWQHKNAFISIVYGFLSRLVNFLCYFSSDRSFENSDNHLSCYWSSLSCSGKYSIVGCYISRNMLINSQKCSHNLALKSELNRSK